MDNYNLKYDIKFIETNPYSINMRYRLKKDGAYICGNASSWLSYSELLANDIQVNSGEVHNYILEWKWVSGSNDTRAGIAGGSAKYRLQINIYAEEI